MKKIFAMIFSSLIIGFPSIGLSEILESKDSKMIMKVNSSDLKTNRGKNILDFIIEVNYVVPNIIDGEPSDYSRMGAVLDCEKNTLLIAQIAEFQVESAGRKMLNREFPNKLYENKDLPNTYKGLTTKVCATATKLGIIDAPQINTTSKDSKKTLSLKDIPTLEETKLSSIPQSLVPEICKNIENVNRNILSTLLNVYGPIPNSRALHEIYMNGNGGPTGVRMVGNNCVITYRVSGTFKGSGYSGAMDCVVSDISRDHSNTKKFNVRWVDVNSCRPI